MSASLPIDKFLKHLFATDAFVASGLVCDKNASGEGGNLKQLYEYARTFESGSFKGLYNFIEFINNIIENGKTLELGASNPDTDCVSLMTIHKSKGLEFPVCFICNAASSMHSQGDKRSAFCFEYGEGIAMDLSDSTGFAKYPSPLVNILRLRKTIKQTEEEMRILYVAMTRARENLYITAHHSRTTMQTAVEKAKTLSMLDDRYFILSADSYLDWVLSSAYSSSEDCFDIKYYTPSDLPSFEDIVIPEETIQNEEIDTELYSALKQKFAFVYPYKMLKRLPAKLSVSRLSPDVLDEADTSADLFAEKKPTQIPDFFLGKQSRATAAQRGTATHLFLQFCNFEYAIEHGIDNALDMLIEKGFLPRDIAELIYKEDLEKLLSSELIQKLIDAKRVYREQRFNMFLPAKLLTKDQALIEIIDDRHTAVQGVIDLITVDRDGKISLYDYKTDRLTREELSDDSLAAKRMNDTHALQLSYYAHAVKFLFGKAPDRVAVYSTCAAKLYDIELVDLSIPPDIL
jgi:ATP-dependent helicase/nuclease subunit A